MKVLNEAIVTPIIFMYPEFAQFDFIEEASEDISLWEIFDEIFSAGLPWDQNGFYSDKNDIQFYVVVRNQNSFFNPLEKWDKKSFEITRKLGL